MSARYSVIASSVNPPSAKCHSVSVYSGYANFRAPSKPAPHHPGHDRGDRKTITRFSPSSRRNFLKKVFSLAVLPEIFITLTYPGFYPADSSTWKRHLDNFAHEFRRRFPGSWFFWKLEPQRRGAPHFHLMGSLGRDRMDINLLRRFIGKNWFRVVGSDDERHLRAGTQADFICDSSGKIRAYVCKYVGKSTESDLPEWATPGRFWGIIGRQSLPATPCCHVLLPRETFFKLRRLVRKWLHRFASSNHYATRLKRMPSFFVLLSHGLLFRMLENAVGFLLPQPDGQLVSNVLDLELIPF